MQIDALCVDRIQNLQFGEESVIWFSERLRGKTKKEYSTVGNGQKCFAIEKVYGFLITRDSRNPEDLLHPLHIVGF